MIFFRRGLSQKGDVWDLQRRPRRVVGGDRCWSCGFPTDRSRRRCSFREKTVVRSFSSGDLRTRKKDNSFVEKIFKQHYIDRTCNNNAILWWYLGLKPFSQLDLGTFRDTICFLSLSMSSSTKSLMPWIALIHLTRAYKGQCQCSLEAVLGVTSTGSLLWDSPIPGGSYTSSCQIVSLTRFSFWCFRISQKASTRNLGQRPSQMKVDVHSHNHLAVTSCLSWWYA